MKLCLGCGEHKSLNQFLRDNRRKDKKAKLCIACVAKSKGYTQYEYEELMLNGHYYNHYSYYEANKKRINSYKSEWGKANPESLKRHSAKYHRENPQVSLEVGARRRARLAGAEVNDFTEDQWSWLKEVYEYRCAYCGKAYDKLEKDHVIPLSKRGDHTLSNIVPACVPCNRHKHDRTPGEAGMNFVVYVNIEYD